jgi:hypothetical protein
LTHVANVVRGDRIVNASRIKRLDGRGKSAATAGIGRDQRELVLEPIREVKWYSHRSISTLSAQIMSG